MNLDSRTRWLALLIVCLGDLMIVLDVTIVGVALPSIREDLAALWQQFVETRWVESSIRFNRMDGQRRQFAYRIVADDPEPGLHRLRVAEIDPG